MNFWFVLAPIALVVIITIFIKLVYHIRMVSLRGRVVLITGAGSGIGRKMALKFAKEGASVLVLWDIRKDLVDKVASEITASNADCKAITYQCDVSNREMLYKVAAQTKKDVGTIDILVNNAGIVSGKPFLELTDEAMQRTMEVNCMAHFWMLRAFLPDMLQRNSGHIVTIASTMGLFGGAGLSDYCASKFGAVGFHECIRLEIARMNKTGVKTTLVMPFGIKTGMFDGLETKHQWLIPLLEEDDVAEEVVYAVKAGKKAVLIPRILNVLYPATRFVPVSWRDAILGYFGGLHGMDKFKGRGLDWAMHKL